MKNPLGQIALMQIALLSLPNYLFAQKSITLNMVDLQRQGKLATINRDISVGQEGTKRFVKIEKELRPGQVPGRDERGTSGYPSIRSVKVPLNSSLVDGTFCKVVLSALRFMPRTIVRSIMSIAARLISEPLTRYERSTLSNMFMCLHTIGKSYVPNRTENTKKASLILQQLRIGLP